MTMFIRFRKLILTHSKPADLKKWLEGREKKTGKALPSILGYPIYVPFKIGEKIR